MAVGDKATAAGYALVPDTGSDAARVRWGAQEINRTRDYLADIKTSLPVGRSGYQTAAGISYGSASPSGGSDGDIYFKVL